MLTALLRMAVHSDSLQNQKNALESWNTSECTLSEGPFALESWSVGLALEFGSRGLQKMLTPPGENNDTSTIFEP